MFLLKRVSSTPKMLGFPQMTPGQKMFFNLFDIQWENKGYSICQIVQNNNLPKWTVLVNPFS